MELRPGLKDIAPARRADARLHHAQPADRDPHRGGPGAALGARRPGRRPGRQAPGAAARGRVAVGAGARRDQDRAVPPHPRPARGGGPGAARLGRQPGRRAARGRGRLAGHRAGVHEPRGRRAGRGKRPEDVQAHLHRAGAGEAGRRASCAPPSSACSATAASASRRSPASPGTPPPAPPRSSTAANYGPSSPPAPRSWTSSSRQPNPAPARDLRQRPAPPSSASLMTGPSRPGRRQLIPADPASHHAQRPFVRRHQFRTPIISAP